MRYVLSNYNCFLHKPVESWETLDLEALSEGVVFGGIDLCEVEWGISLSENSSCGGVFRGELLAVSAISKRVSLPCEGVGTQT